MPPLRRKSGRKGHGATRSAGWRLPGNAAERGEYSGPRASDDEVAALMKGHTEAVRRLLTADDETRTAIALNAFGDLMDKIYDLGDTDFGENEEVQRRFVMIAAIMSPTAIASIMGTVIMVEEITAALADLLPEEPGNS